MARQRERTFVIGPFEEVVTMSHLLPTGPIADSALSIGRDAGVEVINGCISKIAPFREFKDTRHQTITLPYPAVLLPGFIDAHTHLCWAGSRVDEYALRLSGMTYQEIAARGGGILSTVAKTRQASLEELAATVVHRAEHLLARGITTVEVKSGYGLSLEAECKQLRAVARASKDLPVTLLPTCLAAHTVPPEYSSAKAYLDYLIAEVLPVVKREGLAERIDIFVEQHAFPVDIARDYLKKAKSMGFSLCLHADQFSRGGAALAAEVGALTADHLEVSSDEDFSLLARGGVAAVVLPGATLGLGLPFPRARAALDAGVALVIASDWNPGSAPMGDLLTQAALLGAAQKLTVAETLAGITIRAAHALGYPDRGEIAVGQRADFTIFPCRDHRDILYYQGALAPDMVFAKGELCYES